MVSIFDVPSATYEPLGHGGGEEEVEDRAAMEEVNPNEAEA